MSHPTYLDLAEFVIDVMFDAIYDDDIERFVKVKDGRYIIEIDCGPAPTISGVGSILKEDDNA